MYLDHFKLNCRPFESSPDHRFLFLSSQHGKALANVEFALRNKDNFVLISGEIGIGKTTLLNQVLSDISEDITIAHLTHTTLSPIELLQDILLKFGIESFGDNKVYLLKQLTDFFHEQKKAGKQIAILIDEAQNLSKPALEELRLLSCQNLELSGLVSIVLLGQPELNEIIDSPELEQLSQRTRIRQHLAPLSEQESRDYIARRLEVAGGDIDRIINAAALKRIYAYTSGVPRMVNTLCEMSLTAAWLDGADLVGGAHVNYAAHELHWETATEAVRVLATENTHVNAKGWLLQTSAENEESWIPVSRVPFFLGRSATTSLQLRHPHISRRHALIDIRDGKLVVQDYNSYNGTYVNGKRLRREHVLEDGDFIGFGGGLQLTFHTQPAATEQLEAEAIPA